MFPRFRAALFIGIICAVIASAVAGRGDGLYVPFSMPATTCSNQFVRSVAAITGAGTCAAIAAADMPALTGDITSSAGSVATTLASVASAGTSGSSTAIPVVTINVKGLTTTVTTAAVVAPAGTLTGATLASGVTASSLTSLGTLSSTFNVNATAFFPGITSSGAAQTGYLCYGTSVEMIRDSVACLVSSQRFKRDIEPLRNSAIYQLKPVTFRYNANDPVTRDQNSDRIRVGLIAEQVAAVDPRLVGYEKDGVTPRSVDYNGVIAELIAAVQEQRIAIMLLRKQIPNR